MPSVLFLTTDVEDYLADGLLHGLRSLLGTSVVDYPRADRLYSNVIPESVRRVRGRAFSLYGLLPDLPIDRSHVFQRLVEGEFDLVVFSRIWVQYGQYLQYFRKLGRSRVAVLDGEDSPALYPWAGHWLREPRLWTVPRVASEHIYFKRELTRETPIPKLAGVLPKSVRAMFLDGIQTISFSFPEEKIVVAPTKKQQDFPIHIVDPEVAQRIPTARTRYAFESEADYYADLRNSRFGVTTKRAGWDCLRHYEIAANGCVPCFRDLNRKPSLCAPHGLNAENCIRYESADELFDTLQRISDAQYAELQRGALRWVRANTTIARASEFLSRCGFSLPPPVNA